MLNLMHITQWLSGKEWVNYPLNKHHFFDTHWIAIWCLFDDEIYQPFIHNQLSSTIINYHQLSSTIIQDDLMVFVIWWMMMFIWIISMNNQMLPMMDNDGWIIIWFIWIKTSIITHDVIVPLFSLCFWFVFSQLHLADWRKRPWRSTPAPEDQVNHTPGYGNDWLLLNLLNLAITVDVAY
jgi:hypothetical protein